MIFKKPRINKFLLSGSVLIFIIFIVSGYDYNEKLSPKIKGEKIEIKKRKFRIASCPTYYQKLKDDLNRDIYEIIKTNSTIESIDFLEKGEVEAVMAGRTLKPDEPSFNSIILKDGYSFLAQKSQSIYLEDLNNYNFYTDLNPEIIKEKFPIEEIEKVDDVYKYLENGFIVTSWENTNYSKAEIIHLLEENNRRVESSRQATFYYKNKLKDDIIKDIEKVFK